MTFGRRAVLPVDLTMEDNLSAPAAQAKAALGEVNKSASRTSQTINALGDRLQASGSKLREFRRAASELGQVGNALGGDIGAATDQISNIGVTAGSAVLGVRGLIGALGGFVVGLGGVALAGTAAAVALEQYSEAQDKVNLPAREIARNQALVTGLFGDLSAAAAQAADHVDESAHSFRNFALSGNELRNTLAANADFFHQFTDASKDTGAGLDNVDRAARAAKDSLDNLSKTSPIDVEVRIHLNLQTSTADAATLARLRLLGEDPGNLATFGGASVPPVSIPGTAPGGTLQPFSTLPTLTGNAQTLRNLREAQANALKALQTNTDPSKVHDLEIAYRDATEAILNFYKAQADQRASQAKQRAEELARIYKDRVAKEFSNAEKIATTLFDSLHAKHVRAINDAEKLAEKQHDANVQAIQDNLKAQLSANAAPVTAAEKAQQDIENARQLRDLRESLQAAQQNLANLPSTATAEERQAAQRDVRNAQEAIQSFQAGQKIADLKAEQDRKDALAQDAATAATAAENAKLAAAQRQQIIDLAKEAKADRQKRADFEKALADLERRDRGKPVSVIDADIAALEKKFGIFTDPETGAHHIGDAVALAVGNTIRNLKVEPHIDVKVEPHFTVNVDRRGDVSVTQATSVRSAQAVRRFA